MPLLAMASVLRRCAAFDCLASAWPSVATVLGVGGVYTAGMPRPAHDELFRAARLAQTHQRSLRAMRAIVELWMLHRDAKLFPSD